MTSQNAIERAIARLGLKGDAAAQAREGLAVRLKDALRDFAERVARFDNDLSEILRKDFEVALVAGSASLATHTNAAEPMLPDHIVKVTFPGLTYELHRVADEADLDRPWPKTWAYYAIYENTIGTRNTDGERTTLAGNAAVRAGYVPLIENVPSQLGALLIEVLAGYGAPETAATT